MATSAVVMARCAGGADAKNVLGFLGDASPGLCPESDHAALIVRWVAVLLFCCCALECETICCGAQVGGVPGFPRVPDRNIEVDAGEFG